MRLSAGQPGRCVRPSLAPMLVAFAAPYLAVFDMLTSLVMPVDRLDFYKKSKAIDAE